MLPFTTKNRTIGFKCNLPWSSLIFGMWYHMLMLTCACISAVLNMPTYLISSDKYDSFLKQHIKTKKSFISLSLSGNFMHLFCTYLFSRTQLKINHVHWQVLCLRELYKNSFSCVFCWLCTKQMLLCSSYLSSSVVQNCKDALQRWLACAVYIPVFKYTCIAHIALVRKCRCQDWPSKLRCIGTFVKILWQWPAYIPGFKAVISTEFYSLQSEK